MKKKVAIYLTGVKDIFGGGGAERFFSDFFSIYQKYELAKFELFFFCDESTLKALNEVGKLVNEKNVVLLKNVSNRFKNIFESRDFLKKLKIHKIDLLHCANFGRHDANRIESVSHLKGVKTILNIVDCQVPYILDNKNDARYEGYKNRYIDLPKKIKFDGIFSWYELFLLYIEKNKVYDWNPLTQSIHSRFADTSKFQSSEKKENIIVFASRMHFQKNPDWFLKAISILQKEGEKEIENWRFYFIGDGQMSEEMEAFIVNENLSNLVERKLTGDLSEIYPKTSCYVSTQDFENFPSLSMMEAMACGNAIIARNVGQTNLMLHDNENGILLSEDSPAGLAKAIKQYIDYSDEKRTSMQQESLRLVKEVHTPEAFIQQIEDFWVNLL